MSADLSRVEKKVALSAVGDSWVLDKVAYDHARLADFERELPGYARSMLRNRCMRLASPGG